MTHAKFNFNQLMLTLIFGIRASEPPGPGERLKRPGLIGLSFTHDALQEMSIEFQKRHFEKTQKNWLF